VLLAACSHNGRSAPGPAEAIATCSAPPSAARNDTTQNIIVAAADEAALVTSLEQRLRLMGAACPDATVAAASTVNGLPLPAGARSLHMRWLKEPGDDATQAQAEAAFVTRPGDLSLRTVTGESAAPCTGDRALTGTSPADVAVAGQCLHLSSAFVDHLRPTSAAVTPAADPSTWTMSLTLDRSTTPRVANAPKPLFASIDGYPLGRADLVGSVLTATGHYDGGGTEARADASNAQVPIPSILGYAVTS
jgi:hypothetical protein